MRFTPVDGLEQLEGVTFSSEVDEILVILVNPHVSKRSPSPLYFLSCQLVFRFHLHFLLALEETTPGPLNLNSGDVIHSKPVVLKQPSGQRHLVGRLDDGCAEVSKTLIFIFVGHVECTCQELLAQFLGCCQMEALVISRFHCFLTCDLHELVRIERNLAHSLSLTSDFVHLFVL